MRHSLGTIALDRPSQRAAMSAASPSPIYTADTISFLELCWGPGWLSPGGVEDLTELLRGQDLSGLSVLDIGVGAGGPAMTLLTTFDAGHVTGIDVEQRVLDRAADLAAVAGLATRLELCRVEPGPLPFPDAHFDVVFSKDSFLHIADKAQLFAELRRVLVPGGLCAFSDWCCGPPPYSPEMSAFLDNGMDFAMTGIEDTRSLLARTGFLGIEARDRNRWFTAIAEQEARAVAGPRRADITDRIGADAAGRLITTARRRALIAAQGHLRPAHFVARVPG